jgi:phosphatidylinositol glycan class B
MPRRTDAPLPRLPPPPPPPTLSPTSYRDSALAVFALLLAFRTVNALTLRTFFQPDEYFQSLEPAWQLAFGETSHAWITWVNVFP